MKASIRAMVLAVLALATAGCGSLNSGETCGTHQGTCLSSCANPDGSNHDCSSGLTCCLPAE